MVGEHERHGLVSICRGVRESKMAHIPRQHFTKRFQNDKHQKKEAEKGTAFAHSSRIPEDASQAW